MIDQPVQAGVVSERAEGDYIPGARVRTAFEQSLTYKLRAALEVPKRDLIAGLQVLLKKATCGLHGGCRRLGVNWCGGA